jgi:hypothetical protein
MTPLWAVAAILLWGGLATFALAAIMFASQHLGWSRMNWSLLVGTLVTGDRRLAPLFGFLLSCLLGYAVAFVCFALFALTGGAGVWKGLAVGLVLGAIQLVVILPLLVLCHPRIASEYDGPSAIRRLEPPGFLALHLGYPTPLETQAAHAVYGAQLGAGYGLIH